MKNNYNIMTSCDNNLVSYVAIQLVSIYYNLKNCNINFFLVHSRIEDSNLKMLNDLCENFENINLHIIKIPDSDIDIYDSFSKNGGGWCGEAYYSLCVHQLLPENIDRVLYIDAADVLITNDIESYYNCNFENNSLLVTCARFKIENNIAVTYSQNDLNPAKGELPGILRGLFNSGSYMINLEKMRENNLCLSDYQAFINVLTKIYGENHSQIYFGDQGLLSAVFVGDIKYYEFDKIQNIWYMPYNFCMWYYDRMNILPNFTPAIIHFAGNIKPWKGNFPIFIQRFQKKGDLSSLNQLKLGQAEYYYLWHEYALITDNLLSNIE